jgi:hypothetical protein
MNTPAVVARPARTAVQGSAAFAVTELLDSFSILPMDERQYGAVLLILTIVFGAIQIAVENHIGKGLLRDP